MLEKLLASLKSRNSRSGILTADRYFRAIESCFNGGFCPVKLFGNDSDWTKALKESESKLTYTHDSKWLNAKTIKTGAELAPKHVMGFDAIITTPLRDRDKDILDTKGATLDPQAPLLAFHNPMMPIGSLVKQTVHDAKKLAGRFIIADTELGRDIATLIEAKALRISHGFDPTDFEALDDDGWNFKKFLIYEVSVVAIPSNTSAVITEFSREKLHNPVIKQWAGAMFSERPVQVPGVTLSINGTNIDIKTPVATLETKECGCKNKKDLEGMGNGDSNSDTGTDPDEMTLVCPGCGEQYPQSDFTVATFNDEKAFKGRGVPNYDPNYLEGSWEDIESDLYATLKDYLVSKRVLAANSYSWCYIICMFDGYAYVGCEIDYGKGNAYKLAWSVVEDEPAWTGEPEAVSIQLTAEVVETAKHFRKQFKGAAMSRANKKCIKEAHADITELHDMDGMGRPHKAMCKSATGHLDMVLKGMDGEETAASFSSENVIAKALHMEPSVLESLIDSLSGVLFTLESQAEDRKWVEVAETVGL